MGSLSLAIACSSSSSTAVSPIDAGSTNTADSSTNNSSGGAVADGSSIVDANTVDATDANSSGLGDGGNCKQPSDCGSGKVCCGTVKTGPGTAPNCPLESITTTCVDRCVTKLSGGCNSETVASLCVAKSDCAGSSNSECCTFRPGGTQAYSACVPTFAMGLAESCAP
jgi:hypothetical protein